jgi:hypothetical protein
MQRVAGPGNWFLLKKTLDEALFKCRSEMLPLRKKKFLVNDGLSAFSIKEEAGGKIRVFALIDSISQSVLDPLHQFMFAILKGIPNDGTFNQEASVERSKKKSLNGAFSFDLTAATDRLPRALTAAIIDNLLGVKGFGSA